LVKEVGSTPEEISQIEEGFNSIIENEFSFIDQTFSSADESLIPISKSGIKAYIKHRANNRYQELGLDLRVPMTPEEKKEAKELANWFEPAVKGLSNHDFFSQREGSQYVAKPSQDFKSVDLTDLNLDLV
jgi:ribonucleotide reductase beta subunit family protein with ferritin-like domain